MLAIARTSPLALVEREEQAAARFAPTPKDIHDANEPPGLCPNCGGGTCSCEACLASVAELARGNWTAAQLQPHAALRATGWTTDGGLLLREP
jgi:hypothetical protein